ncbi:hypothetical protein QAD02_007828 [Eretmocerus hayati]|uniref:Uncharacterized protein n=1 Tax=Eretmocerus hayati TaxID=131215 RepID=A0ACC2N5J8_9HYME|nr:hypothetical protein QAD02_007828 [Eretmocerus hayati]
MDQQKIEAEAGSSQVQDESTSAESRAKSPDILWLLSSDSDREEKQVVPRPDTPMPDIKKPCESKYLKRRVKLYSGVFNTKFMRDHGPHGRVGLVIKPLNIRAKMNRSDDEESEALDGELFGPIRRSNTPPAKEGENAAGNVGLGAIE